jgi:hypothetical protein
MREWWVVLKIQGVRLVIQSRALVFCPKAGLDVRSRTPHFEEIGCGAILLGRRTAEGGCL